ncbi:hypothetical protein GBV73_10605 [Thermococcus sp. 101 C5]|uniref:hypothetical protein n=1 Tax=Thermococcus bergensis TaxID=2689387 RepID=UPI00128D04DD|nr:hypothetical protein [Thermococcus bergensis]MCA6213018.1 hypothetical protein [Thermococcus bergensis]MPW40095.1 hypothetical protein [Thermococcus sp. 101 C5]
MKKASLILCLLVLIAATPTAAEEPKVIIEVNPNLGFFLSNNFYRENGNQKQQNIGLSPVLPAFQVPLLFFG